MHNLVKIENEKSMARDISSHAVVETSDKKVLDYRSRRLALEAREKELSNQKNEIEYIKSEMQEIKSMLKKLLQG